MKMRIFTDGACSGNPGPGGWAAIFNFEDKTRKLVGYEVHTTNNRMELIAVVNALKKIKVLKKSETLKKYDGIEIYSDSAYVVNAVNNKWIDSWKKNGWKTTSKDDVKNAELWRELDELLKVVDVKLIKVKGHAGIMSNEMADEEARRMVEKAKREIV